MPLRFLLLTRARTSRQHSRAAVDGPAVRRRVVDHSRQTPTRVRMNPRSFPAAARDLAAVGRRFYARGWVLGTSGNFSAVLARRPCAWRSRRARSTKARCEPRTFCRSTNAAPPLGAARGTPSAETLLHLEIVRRRGAGAVLHTHSVWSTILSDAPADRGGLTIEGFEMLKGLTASAPTSIASGFRSSTTIRTWRVWRASSARRSTGTRRARVPAAAARALHVGRDTRRRGAPRRDFGVLVRDDWPKRDIQHVGEEAHHGAIENS